MSFFEVERDPEVEKQEEENTETLEGFKKPLARGGNMLFAKQQRKDNRLRNLMTDMRNSVSREFQRLSGYKSKKRYKGRGLLRECLAKFAIEAGVGEPSMELLFTLGALVAPKDMLLAIDSFI